MRLRTVFLIIVIIATAAFLILNWSVFAAKTSFYFGFGSAELPMGVVLLTLSALIVLVTAIYVGIWQGSVLMDQRRQSKELQTQRKLADDAEASRFTELNTLLRDEMSQLSKRLEAATEALRGEIRETEHSIAATLAEMDDRNRRANKDIA